MRIMEREKGRKEKLFLSKEEQKSWGNRSEWSNLRAEGTFVPPREREEEKERQCRRGKKNYN